MKDTSEQSREPLSIIPGVETFRERLRKEFFKKKSPLASRVEGFVDWTSTAFMRGGGGLSTLSTTHREIGMNTTIRIYFWFGTSWASLIVNDNNIYIITVYIILYGTDYSTTQYCKLVRTSTYSARVCFRYGESRTIFIRRLSVESYGPLRRANSSLEEEDSRMVSYSFNIKKRTKRWFKISMDPCC